MIFGSSALRIGLSTIAALLFALLSNPARAQSEQPRQLFIVLDAVPYGVVAEITAPALGERAAFRKFQPPVPLISTFPSSTSIALGGILESLGVGISPGYEARFFDWGERRARGGGPISYYQIEFPWRSFFDWGKKGAGKSISGAIRPLHSSYRRFENSLAAFAASNQQRFLIYVESTDTAAHLFGPGSLRELLYDLDAGIDALRVRGVEPFETVILSDHGIAGGEPLVNVCPAVREVLLDAKYVPSDRLGGERAVVFTPFGLVSSFEIYVETQHVEDVAAHVVSLEGVDLCVHKSAPDAWRVFGGSGTANIERRGSGASREWRYEPVTGDPLGYARFYTAGGEPDWRSDDRWFEATAGHDYPDALHRLARAFELVGNPASLVCAAAGGHMFGARRAENLARLFKGRLRWTHGALSRTASWGFLMTDRPGTTGTAPLRFDRALELFLDDGPSPANAETERGR